jgi:nitroreductase
MYSDFLDLVKRRQSCRDFNDKPLDSKVVETIAETAMLAPSACNSQPWRMYLVTNEETVKKVTDAVQERGHNKFASGAKAYIVVCDKQATLRPGTESKFDRNHFVKYDVGELIAYITLTAESMGVASCILGWINYAELKQAIGHPDEEVCNIVVALGYTDTPIRTKVRKDKAEIIKKV